MRKIIIIIILLSLILMSFILVNCKIKDSMETEKEEVEDSKQITKDETVNASKTEKEEIMNSEQTKAEETTEPLKTEKTEAVSSGETTSITEEIITSEESITSKEVVDARGTISSWEIVDSWETIFALVEAIINEHFPGRITESTQYAGIGLDMDHIGARCMILVYVAFETDKDFNLHDSLYNLTNMNDVEKIADVIVTIYRDNGEFFITELR